MKKIIYISTIFLTGLLFNSCSDYLEPEFDSSRLSEEQMLNDPAYTEGLLAKAYADLPDNYDFNLDVASDDAVTNDLNSPYLSMATGQWKSQNNPIAAWTSAYNKIFYINQFIDRIDLVEWSSNERLKELHIKRLTGEALGLRAWYEFMLLQGHSGKTADGKIMGFPIILKSIIPGEEWRIPRNTFKECVDQIIADCDVAIANLPMDYLNTATDQIYNEGMGSRWTNRLTARAVKAFKSRVLLYAASPAYNAVNSAELWTLAANTAKAFLEESGGLSALSPTGLNFYVYNSTNDKDVIWARAISSSSDLEAANFPPSLIGKGRTNPTQELVDAFPMKNGLPISASASGYSQSDPYKDRDPRLSKYIIYNGLTFGSKGVINTHVGAPQNGINQQTNSTRTGYYLRKFMLENVQIENPNVPQNHFYTYIRYTEVFLNYAEAANEAWGPDGNGGNGLTARQVIASIRARAGITAPDAYLASLTTKEQFRELIHTERRIELCFEGHRFWDIRRWDKKNVMKAPVKGAFISGNNFEYKEVEQRSYQDYMIYGPIPYSEILKYNGLLQNQGW
jgi:hypothetical protein